MSHWLHMEQGGAAGGAGGGAHAGGGPLCVLRRGLHRRKAPARPRPRVVPGMPHPVSPVSGNASPPAAQIGTCAQLQANLSNASSDVNTRGDAPVTTSLVLEISCVTYAPSHRRPTAACPRPTRSSTWSCLWRTPWLAAGLGASATSGYALPAYRFCSHGFICRGRIQCSKQCIGTRFKQN